MNKFMRFTKKLVAGILCAVCLTGAITAHAATPPKGNYQLSENLNAMKFLYQCASWQNRLRSDLSSGKSWLYTNSGADLKKNLTNCAHFANSVAVRSGIVKSMHGMYSHKTDGLICIDTNYFNAKTRKWKNTSTDSNKKALAKIEGSFSILTDYYGKTVTSIQSKLQPGDIVLYSIQHVNVFAGYINGKYCWYDAGHSNCSGSGDRVPFRTFYCEGAPANWVVNYILRPKKDIRMTAKTISDLNNIENTLYEMQIAQHQRDVARTADEREMYRVKADCMRNNLYSQYGADFVQYIQQNGTALLRNIIAKNAPVAKN